MDSTPEQTRHGPSEVNEATGAPDGIAHAAPASDSEQLHLLLVRLGRELFAIGLAAVEEAIEATAVQRVPDMPEAMLGVCDVRGSLIPVYSPAGALRTAPASARAEESVLLVMRLGARRVGVAVDDVEDVCTVAAASLRHPALPGTSDGVVVGVARVGAELAVVIDPAALLAACGAVPLAPAAPAGATASAGAAGAAIAEAA